jgi:hypothetical protein
MVTQLVKTLRTMRQVSSVSEEGFDPDDALIIGDIDIVLRVLRSEIRAFEQNDEIKPRLILALSKIYQSLNEDELAISFFERATGYLDQERGYYIDVGHSAMQLCRASGRKEFHDGVRQALDRLIPRCPFRDDLVSIVGANG